MIVRTLSVLATALAVVAVISAPRVAAFAPSKMPQLSSAPPQCIACAFLADQWQWRLPVAAYGQKEPIATDPARLAKFAVTVQEATEAILKDGWVFNVDTNRVDKAPEDEALRNAPPPPNDLDHEPASVIIARRDRRVTLGMRPTESPWHTTVLADFAREHVLPRAAHHTESKASVALRLIAASNLTREELDEIGVTPEQLAAATQSNADDDHPSDLVRTIAAFVDTANLDRRRPAEHFLARMACVAELGVCGDDADVAALEAIEVRWDDERIDAERSWRAHKALGLETPRDLRGVPEGDEAEFRAAFVHRLAEAVRGANAARPAAKASDVDGGDL